MKNGEQTSLEETLGFIRKYAGEYAKAKSDRVHLEQFRKSKKAMLVESHRVYMADIEGKKASEAQLENHAYSHPEYIGLLEGLRVAVEKEEKLSIIIKGCWMQIEIWRTEQANDRAERTAYQVNK
jgi:hypothetical protein